MAHSLQFIRIVGSLLCLLAWHREKFNLYLVRNGYWHAIRINGIGQESSPAETILHGLCTYDSLRSIRELVLNFLAILPM
ncbi:hypothetical protein G4B88_003098 [Cannabis sativa]|uniref:Secreted protein n=1 Tax=Cannabis sativa TaxID=3483 RepID=A0A7J6H2H2_CANSA|nr:hypothetical protein G4B88_003098 [Cannabis sativa]